MDEKMMCKGCGKPESECMCADCSNKGGCAMPGVCNCGHHKIIPGLVVIFGLLFLLQALGIISDDTTAVIWPVLVIIGGCAKWSGGMCKCYHKHY